MAQGVGPKFKPQSGERERDKERDREREREREKEKKKEGGKGGRKEERKEGRKSCFPKHKLHTYHFNLNLQMDIYSTFN
jgi:hypothetical protein